MSGDRSSPRYNVVATTRRSWSRQQKRAIVAEVDVDGATLSQVARRHGIAPSLLFRWRRSLGSVTGRQQASSGIAASTPATPGFVPVMLAPPAAAINPPAPAAPLAVRPGAIEVVLDGGRLVRVEADADMDLLVRVVEALEGLVAGSREKGR